ncbi:hypothetical protein ATL42_2578 [Sanguibacter antarcticus]|uniref:YCII-related domain-containing protein n=2 Tax=Sanguibacter antarcticus TaxID=372484 RepID=A0A2A9E6S7_9MICO|nr:YciI family protein [Sanguibacter antarcticus]PFG34658.1 hypothetical protein ATL42_2578 [Sanguibacter antarcticus]
MEYMLFICTDPSAPAYVAAEDNIGEWVAETRARGVARHGNRLRPVEDATTVTVRAGEVVVSDGPFAETKEWIAGYDILDCTDLDEAIEMASKHPMARFGKIEIRPVWPFDEPVTGEQATGEQATDEQATDEQATGE